MMDYLFILLATGMLLLGHLIRFLRWEQFIEVYERPRARSLLQSMSVGFLVNFFLPFHVGDVVRAFLAGRLMENGIAFALATMVVERYLDIVVVGLAFAFFAGVGMGGAVAFHSWQFYVWVVLLLLPLTIILLKYSRYPKGVVRRLAGIFNERIQLQILFASWVMISSFKDMYLTLSKKRLFLLTMGMWGSYVLAYFLLAMGSSADDVWVAMIGIFSSLFSSDTFRGSTLQAASGVCGIPSIVLYGYVIFPLLGLLAISCLPERVKDLYRKVYMEPKEYVNMLPQLRQEDRLNFLESYFSNRNHAYVMMYLKINRDINIVRDYSAGSNATTILCVAHMGTFFRKYAFGEDGEKLHEQVKWLQYHEAILPLPHVLQERYTPGCCYYDMAFNSAAVNLFDYVHSVPIERSWKLLEGVLDCLDQKLYQPTQWVPVGDDGLKGYIENKVLKNLQVIQQGSQFRDILKYETIFINGMEYKNLLAYSRQLSAEYLYEVFRKDTYAEIHGDLTIENIICVQGETDDFYIIDPNTGNIHESPNLDYGKLLQSLHGGYEFLMMVKQVHVRGNRIDFLYAKSLVYERLLQQYVLYLQQHFSTERVQSIFYHELVHWLRLLPYKIYKNGDLALVFYAEFICLLHDICDKEDMVD